MSEAPEGGGRSRTDGGASTPVPWVNLASLAVAIGGLFLPWVTGNGPLHMGVVTDTGIVFAIALFVTVVLTGPQVRRVDRETTWALVAAWFILFAIAVYEIVRLSTLSATLSPGIQIGVGLYLCTLASAVGTAAATLAASDRWLAQCADPWIKTRSTWLPATAAVCMVLALGACGFLAHDSVHQSSSPVSAVRPIVGTHLGIAAPGSTSNSRVQRATTPTNLGSSSSTTSTAAGDTGNTAPTGPGDFPGIAMDTVWPGYTGAPGSDYVWPGYLTVGNTGVSGNSGSSGATGITGATGSTGSTGEPSSSTTLPTTAVSQTPAGVSGGGGGQNSESGA